MSYIFQKDDSTVDNNIDGDVPLPPNSDSQELYTIKKLHNRTIIWERRKNEIQYWFDFKYRVEWVETEKRENITAGQFGPLEDYVRENHPHWYKPHHLKSKK